jgi:hypothetical protein
MSVETGKLEHKIKRSFCRTGQPASFRAREVRPR